MVGWRLGSSRILLVLLAIVVMLGVGEYLREYYNWYAPCHCIELPDFTVAYYPAQALVAGALHQVYNISIIERWLAGDPTAFFHPTLYPPYSLWLFWPLGLLSPALAMILWFGSHAVLLICVLCMRKVRSMLAGVAPLYIGIFFLPFCLFTLIAGQVGMLSAALFLLVICWRKTHPVLAGIAFGVLCFKPQMTLALILLLVNEKNRVAVLNILIWLITFTVLSIALWGAGLWHDFIQVTALSGMVASAAFPVLVNNMVSLFMGIRMLGGSTGLADGMQLCMTGGVAITLWCGLNRCGNDAERLLLLAPATFLLTPYAFIYDTVFLAPACVVLAVHIHTVRASIVPTLLLGALSFMPLFFIRLQEWIHFPVAMLTIFFTYLYACKHVYCRPSLPAAPEPVHV